MILILKALVEIENNGYSSTLNIDYNLNYDNEGNYLGTGVDSKMNIFRRFE